ncbi:MAG: ABC transporter ATP-binding protein [Candidatus Aminicenantes bacterium]|nr:ABC transporter ATP-binding protein [Candidatus Aminicenantes bacterium]
MTEKKIHPLDTQTPGKKKTGNSPVPQEENTLKDIAKFIAPYWKKGIIPVLFLLVSTIISFAYPMFSKWAIDGVVLKKDYDMLPTLAITFLILILLQRLFSYLNQITFFKFQKDSILDIQVNLLRKIFYYPMEFFDKNHSGYMMGRIRGDVAGLSYIFSEGLVMTVMDFVKFAGVFVILMTMNVKLTLISVCILPFLLLKIFSSKAGIKKINEKILEENARLEKELSDTFQGIEVFKSFSKEEEGIKRTEEGITGFQQIEVERNLILSKYRSIMGLIVHFGEVLLLYFGIGEVLAGNLTLGSYMAFSGYLMFLYGPIRNLSTLNILFDYAQRSYKRIRELLDILPEDSGPVEIEEIERIDGENLSFSYEGRAGIIKGLDFSIKKGDKVLVEGESGSGKSTLVKLLLGLYRPQAGEIKYNGIDLKEIDLKKLRERVGYISQNVFLFNKTVKENIILGHEAITDKELEKLLRECKLDKRINSFEKGLYEEISEKGYNFSGGERQRIALARALVKDPEIIIIDEGTSNLDVETEEEVLQKIEEKFHDKIIIRVTHRRAEDRGWKKITV